MNYVTGMEVVQPLSNVIQLVMGSALSDVTQYENTYKAKSVRVRVAHDVPHEVPARHPVRDELGRVDSGTQKGNNIWVVQSFPYHS